MPRGDAVNVDAVDIRNNRVEFNVVDKAELHLKLDSSGVSLPLGVSVVEVDALSNPTADIFGGKTLTYKGPPRKECTSGFSVTDGTNEGVTTAGHFEDKQSYDGTSLNWESGTDQHPYDIQWFSTTAFTVRNLVYDGTNNRYIYDQELPGRPVRGTERVHVWHNLGRGLRRDTQHDFRSCERRNRHLGRGWRQRRTVFLEQHSLRNYDIRKWIELDLRPCRSDHGHFRLGSDIRVDRTNFGDRLVRIFAAR